MRRLHVAAGSLVLGAASLIGGGVALSSASAPKTYTASDDLGRVGVKRQAGALVASPTPNTLVATNTPTSTATPASRATSTATPTRTATPTPAQSISGLAASPAATRTPSPTPTFTPTASQLDADDSRAAQWEARARATA
jgi:hypothetical protein